MAVALEPGKVDVARLLEVHLHAVDHGVEVLARQRMLAHHLHERAGHRMPRRAVEHGIDLAAPPGELDAGHGRIGDLVDDVVHLAAERVHRGDRAAALRRQEQEL